MSNFFRKVERNKKHKEEKEFKEGLVKKGLKVINGKIVEAKKPLGVFNIKEKK